MFPSADGSDELIAFATGGITILKVVKLGVKYEYYRIKVAVSLNSI